VWKHHRRRGHRERGLGRAPLAADRECSVDAGWSTPPRVSSAGTAVGSRIDPGACSQGAESRGCGRSAGCARRPVLFRGWAWLATEARVLWTGVPSGVGAGDIRGLTRHCWASPLSIMGRRALRCGAAVPFGRPAGAQIESPAGDGLHRLYGGRAAPPNKRMKLTSLSAAPGRRERRLARHGQPGRTGSQLIRGVRWTDWRSTERSHAPGATRGHMASQTDSVAR
jgi:hypothetical protein